MTAEAKAATTQARRAQTLESSGAMDANPDALGHAHAPTLPGTNNRCKINHRLQRHRHIWHIMDGKSALAQVTESLGGEAEAKARLDIAKSGEPT